MQSSTFPAQPSSTQHKILAPVIVSALRSEPRNWAHKFNTIYSILTPTSFRVDRRTSVYLKIQFAKALTVS
jgi:hypothetical protein